MNKYILIIFIITNHLCEQLFCQYAQLRRTGEQGVRHLRIVAQTRAMEWTCHKCLSDSRDITEKSICDHHRFMSMSPARRNSTIAYCKAGAAEGDKGFCYKVLARLTYINLLGRTMYYYQTKRGCLQDKRPRDIDTYTKRTLRPGCLRRADMEWCVCLGDNCNRANFTKQNIHFFVIFTCFLYLFL